MTKHLKNHFYFLLLLSTSFPLFGQQRVITADSIPITTDTNRIEIIGADRLTLLKGFGEKTQANVLRNLEFYLSKKGFYRYAEVEKLAESIEAFFQTQLHVQVQLTGNFRRRMEVLEAILRSLCMSTSRMRGCEFTGGLDEEGFSRIFVD